MVWAPIHSCGPWYRTHSEQSKNWPQNQVQNKQVFLEEAPFPPDVEVWKYFQKNLLWQNFWTDSKQEIW